MPLATTQQPCVFPCSNPRNRDVKHFPARGLILFFFFSFFFFPPSVSRLLCRLLPLSRSPFRRVISAKTRRTNKTGPDSVARFHACRRVILRASSSGNQTRSIELCRVPCAPCSYVSRALETFREIDRGWAIARFRAFWLFQPFPVFNGASYWILLLLLQPAARSFRRTKRATQTVLSPCRTVSQLIVHARLFRLRVRGPPPFSYSRCPA